MVRGLFDNQDAINYLTPTAAPGHTIHIPSGEIAPLWEVASRYREAHLSTLIVAGERYGMGSSRDWAAKGVALLGVRAILAQSFERIHRTNLVGMGILPIVLPKAGAPQNLDLKPGDMIFVDASAITPRCKVGIQVKRQNGTELALAGEAAIETELEVEMLQVGGLIPLILRSKTLKLRYDHRSQYVSTT
ncbi:hypothetical protein [Mesorhizobium sp. M0041]|uniref:hypothetical protein n=1 Tax=Mesorhizobium sp. M0041 TaxID=2956856 RepID=UPI00333796DA